MTTTVFNLSAVDRIETDVKDIQATQMAQTEALTALAKTIQDFITALGGGDQQAIDAVTANLQSLTQSLRDAAARDRSP